MSLLKRHGDKKQKYATVYEVCPLIVTIILGIIKDHFRCFCLSHIETLLVLSYFFLFFFKQGA